MPGTKCHRNMSVRSIDTSRKSTVWKVHQSYDKRKCCYGYIKLSPINADDFKSIFQSKFGTA